MTLTEVVEQLGRVEDALGLLRNVPRGGAALLRRRAHLTAAVEHAQVVQVACKVHVYFYHVHVQ